MNFRQFNDAELANMGDEELVAYINSAREAGQIEAAVEAAQVLAWRYEKKITGFVYKRIGDLGDVPCDKVIGLTITGAVESVKDYEGSTIKEFGKWIFTIARRRIIDLHRERERRVDEVTSQATTEDGETQDREFSSGDTFGAIDDASVFQQALDGRSEVHRTAIVLTRLRGLSHKEVATEINRHFGDELDDPMTEQNVSQINSRFKKDLDDLLDQADQPPPDDD